MNDTVLIEQPRKKRKSLPIGVVRANYRQLRKLSPVFGPKLFSPLKVGIREDVMRMHPQFCDERLISAILRHHTSKPGYLMKMVAGAQRVDLNGEAAGIVTDEAAAFAAERLAKIKPQSAPKAVTRDVPSHNRVGGQDVSPEKVEVTGGRRPPESQSQRCAEISASLGGARNRETGTFARKAPVVVVKRSRAASKARA